MATTLLDTETATKTPDGDQYDRPPWAAVWVAIAISAIVSALIVLGLTAGPSEADVEARVAAAESRADAIAADSQTVAAGLREQITAATTRIREVEAEWAARNHNLDAQLAAETARADAAEARAEELQAEADRLAAQREVLRTIRGWITVWPNLNKVELPDSDVPGYECTIAMGDGRFGEGVGVGSTVQIAGHGTDGLSVGAVTGSHRRADGGCSMHYEVADVLTLDSYEVQVPQITFAGFAAGVAFERADLEANGWIANLYRTTSTAGPPLGFDPGTDNALAAATLIPTQETTE